RGGAWSSRLPCRTSAAFGGDVAAVEESLEADSLEGGIREPSRGFAVVAEGRHPEHASARRHDAAVRESRAGVVDLDVAGRDRLRLLEPDDGEALLIALGISAGRADDADRGARIPLEGEAG